MIRRLYWMFLLAALGVAAFVVQSQSSRPSSRPAKIVAPREGEQVATFAGGCFWCMEPPFEGLPGVRSVLSGYSGGSEKDPTYEQVSSGRTGHAEAVQIVFDPKVISYEKLLAVFWRSMDPTDAGGQFADRGRQYRPAIFVHDDAQRKIAERSKRELGESSRFDKPIVVEITNYGAFYPAEAYHQNYYLTHPRRYKAYRNGSGRTGFLARVWADERKEAANASERYQKPPVAELRRRLTRLQYEVTQLQGTEPPYDNAYWKNKRAGIYVDVVSGEPLFSSQHKYESGTGWPSFYRPLDPKNVVEVVDRSHGMTRTEVRSKHGDSHLGHLFQDGPAPTGLRYCINSASLRFIPVQDLEREGYGEFARRFGEPSGKQVDRKK